MLRGQFRRAVAWVFALAAVALPCAAPADDGEESPPYTQGWQRSREVALVFVPAGGGGWKTTYDTGPTTETRTMDGGYSVIAHGGLRAAGYFVLRRRWQLGAYATADTGVMKARIDGGTAFEPDYRPLVVDAAAGVALKRVRRGKRGLFTGFGLEIGAALFHGDLRNDDVRPQFGAAAVIRVVFEIPMGDEGDFALSFSLGLGGSIVDGRALDSTGMISTRWIRIEVPLLFGVAFGS
jgi:hypothetical protein